MNARPMFAVVTIVAALLAGCTSTSEDRAATGDDQNLTQLNGENADAYYAKLIYRREKSSSGEYWHFYPETVPDVKLPSGHTASVELYMRDGGTFTADYTESRPVDATQQENVHHETLSGTWRVADAKLVLEGLGTAEGTDINERPGLVLTFSRDVHDSGLRGRAAHFAMIAATYGPDGNTD